MFTTTQPIDIGGGAKATQAYALIHFTPYAKDGKVQENVLFRAQRVLIGDDGTVTPVGDPIDRPFTPDQLAAARKANPALDSALTALSAALDALAPTLGL